MKSSYKNDNKSFHDKVDLLITSALSCILRDKPFYFGLIKKINKHFNNEFNGRCGIFYSKSKRSIVLLFNPNTLVHSTVDEFVIILEHMIHHLIHFYLFLNKEVKQSHSYNLAIDLYTNSNLQLINEYSSRIKRGKVRAIPANTILSSDIKQLLNYNSMRALPDVKTSHEILLNLTQEILSEFSTLDVHDVVDGLSDDYVPINKIMSYFESVDILVGANELKKIDVSVAESLSEYLKNLIKETASSLSEKDGGNINYGTMGNIDGSSMKVISDICNEKSQINYTQFISHFVRSVSRDEKIRSWTRVNRKYPGEVRGRKKVKGPRIVCGVDTSGSVWSDSTLARFQTEIMTIRLHSEDLWIVMGDTRLRSVIHVKNNKITREQLVFHGGGGTNLQFIWDFAKSVGDIDGVIVNTDGEIPWFNSYGIPSVFVISPNGQFVPGYKNTRI